MSVIPFRHRYAREYAKNLNDFIERAKNELTLYEDQGGFQSLNWKHRYPTGKTTSMEFTSFAEVKGQKTGAPMEQPYLDFARAYVREIQSINAVSSAAFMAVLKAVYGGLRHIHGKADILLFDGPSLRIACELLEHRLSKDTLYRAGQRLELLIDWLKTNNINITIPSWKNPWNRGISKAQGTSDEARQHQQDHLLTEHQICCFADAFNLAKNPRDLYFSAQAVLLMIAPSRAGELYFLTTDCLSEDYSIEQVFNTESGTWEEKQKTILNINWKAAKGGGLYPKAVHPRIEHVVRETVKRLIDIGAEARKAASWAIERPQEFYRHSKCITAIHHAEDDPLTYEEFCAAFSLEPNSRTELSTIDANRISKFTNTKWCKALCEGKSYLTYRDLAKFTLDKYKKIFPKWPNLAEVKRPVCDALCLVRENEFHAEFAVKEYSWEMPDINRLNFALGSAKERIKNAESMFSSHGLKDEDGRDIMVTSHQIRGWYSTHAQRSGMDSLDLAMFAGRIHIEDNTSYDLRSQEEMESIARDILDLKKGQSGGSQAITAYKVNAPITYEMLGGDRPGTAQFSQYGYCEWDWSMMPCTKAGDCSFCSDHACVKGLPGTLDNQKDLYKIVKMEFERAVEAYKNGKVGSDRWVNFHATRLATLATTIKMMGDDNLPDGHIIRIPKELDPSRTMIALANNGLTTEIIADNPVAQSFIDNTQNLFLSILRGEIES